MGFANENGSSVDQQNPFPRATSRLFKLSVFSKDVIMYEPNLLCPEVGFKFLGFPLLKVNIFKDKSTSEAMIELMKKGVSIADLDFIETDPESQTCLKRRYLMNNGKSSLFMYRVDEILERSKETPLYVFLKNQLTSEEVLAVGSIPVYELVNACIKNESEFSFTVKGLKMYESNTHKLLGSANFDIRLLCYDEMCSEIMMAKLKMTESTKSNIGESVDRPMMKNKQDESLIRNLFKHLEVNSAETREKLNGLNDCYISQSESDLTDFEAPRVIDARRERRLSEDRPKKPAGTRRRSSDRGTSRERKNSVDRKKRNSETTRKSSLTVKSSGYAQIPIKKTVKKSPWSSKPKTNVPKQKG